MTVSGFILQLTHDEYEYKKTEILARRKQDLGISVTVFCGVKGCHLCQGIALYHDTSSLCNLNAS